MIGGYLRDLVIPECVEPDGQDEKHDRDEQRGAGVPGESHGHTCLTAVAENRPDGRTISTSISTARPKINTRSEPR